MVKKITNNDMQEALVAPLALVDFSATWCGPCQMLAPVFDELAEEMGSEVNFYSVDVDANSQLAEQYNIMSVPSILLFKNGEKAAQTVGFQSKESLADFVRSQM